MTKKMTKNNTLSEKDVLANLEPFSKLLSKSVSELWKIFVRRYVAKGISEIFISLCLFGIGYNLFNKHTAFMWFVIIPSLVLIYDAIQLLINPYYFAMNDVVKRVREGKYLK